MSKNSKNRKKLGKKNRKKFAEHIVKKFVEHLSVPTHKFFTKIQIFSSKFLRPTHFFLKMQFFSTKVLGPTHFFSKCNFFLDIFGTHRPSLLATEYHLYHLYHCLVLLDLVPPCGVCLSRRSRRKSV